MQQIWFVGFGVFVLCLFRLRNGTEGTVHRQKLSHPQEQFTLDIGHLPVGVYHIELYPEDNAERVFYGVQVVLSK
ncbi:MAG: hypothetical protein EA411_09050 [Saprospirales bacterium]|nr:MAG: hypothetical protein EA411_09050 [Saprospirales bacterium]